MLAGDAETGVCVQRMVLALDEGDVVLEERTPIGAHETAGELQERLLRAWEPLAHLAVSDFPEHLRPDLDWIWQECTKVGNSPEVTIPTMSDEAALRV